MPTQRSPTAHDFVNVPVADDDSVALMYRCTCAQGQPKDSGISLSTNHYARGKCCFRNGICHVQLHFPSNTSTQRNDIHVRANNSDSSNQPCPSWFSAKAIDAQGTTAKLPATMARANHCVLYSCFDPHLRKMLCNTAIDLNKNIHKYDVWITVRLYRPLSLHRGRQFAVVHT